MIRRGLPVSTTCLAALAVLTALTLLPRPAGSDQPSDALAKYDKPVDTAVDKALAFLAKQQLPDGSFQSQMKGNTGVASLSVMAFLAKGHTPGLGPYGQVISKGIDYVLSAQQPDGMILGTNPSYGPMYCHTISTLMLSEVSGMVDKERQKRIDKALPRALKFILTAQQVKKRDAAFTGGWRYTGGPKDNDSDLSCSGWALMSLRSARNNGAQVPKEAIDLAVKFIRTCRAADGGFSYQPGAGPALPLTGAALLCMELCGLHGDAATTAAGEWILKRLPKNFGEGYFYYGLYYCSQGMFQLGDKYWETYATHMYEMMLKFQQADGSWPAGGGQEGQAGPCYSTAMGVLALSVSFRQLPIYQR